MPPTTRTEPRSETRTEFAGGCACGAIRYESRSAPIAMYHCHCGACQHASGAAFAPLLVLAADTLRISGNPRYRRLIGTTGNHTSRGFCADCGCQLFARDENKPELVLVHAASLDEPTWFRPIADIWTTSAQPWACMDRHIPKVFKSPPVLEKDELSAL